MSFSELCEWRAERDKVFAIEEKWTEGRSVNRREYLRACIRAEMQPLGRKKGRKP